MTSDPSAIPLPDDEPPDVQNAAEQATIVASPLESPAPVAEVTAEVKAPPKPEPVYGRSILLAPLVLFAPGFIGRKTARANLLMAIILHLAATTAFFIYGFVMVVWYVAVSQGNPAGIFDEFVELFTDLPPLWYEKLLVAAGFILGFLAVEGAHILLVFLLWPWVARDEPVTDSFIASLRRVALWTVGVLGPAVVMLTPAFTLDAWWWYEYSNGWNYGSGTMSYEAWQDSLIIVLRYRTAITILLWFGLIVWAVWALMRFAGSDRPTRPLPREKLCEQCGYNLMHMTMDQSCPECGLGVTQTFGEHVRPGVEWRHNAKWPNPVLFLANLWDAVIHPVTLGKKVRTREYTTAHRLFFLIILFCLAFISAFCITLMNLIWSFRYGGITSLDWEELALMPLVAGYMTVGFALLITLGSALLCGAVQSIWNKRNLMYPAMQGACYLGGILILWNTLFWMTLLIGQFSDVWEVFEALGNMLKMDGEFVVFWFYFLLFGGFICIFVYLNSRIAKFARYANK